jgi:hypothetical protein
MNILVIANVPMRLRSHTATPGRSDPIARWQGLREYETHRVPAGAKILDAKYCEWCGCNFLREAKSSNRYCSKCWPLILTLNARKAQKLASQLIH